MIQFTLEKVDAMPILYSRRIMITVFLALLAATLYATYLFTTTSIVIGTIIDILALLYIWAYATLHISRHESAAAVVLSTIFMVLGGVIGAVLSGNIGAVFYVVSLTILSLGIASVITKYVI